MLDSFAWSGFIHSTYSWLFMLVAWFWFHPLHGLTCSSYACSCPLALVQAHDPTTFTYFHSSMAFHLIIYSFLAHGLLLSCLDPFHLIISSTWVILSFIWSLVTNPLHVVGVWSIDLWLGHSHCPFWSLLKSKDSSKSCIIHTHTLFWPWFFHGLFMDLWFNLSHGHVHVQVIQVMFIQCIQRPN